MSRLKRAFCDNDNRQQPQKRVLVMTAVSAEREAVLRGLGNDRNTDVFLAGVGAVSAAVHTTKVLAKEEYGLVICAGIGGGFPGRAEIGSIVVANEIVAVDLGAETSEGFQSLDELGLGTSRIPVEASLVNDITNVLLAARLPVQTGPVLTVSTVTGSATRSAQLAARVPEAAAEAMEGYGVAFAAVEHGIPVVELRAISNLVGPRDRAAWRIKEALDMLTTVSSVLLGELNC